MDSRALAALLSSIISELLLLLLLLFPSSNPLSLTNSNSNSYANLFPLIHHFISSSQLATSLSLLSLPRKRKRNQTHQSQSDDDDDDEDDQGHHGSELARLNSGLTRSLDSFKGCFRMTSSTFEWLAGLLEPLLECRDPVGSPLNLSAQLRLGIGLFRLSTGADYPEISRQFGVSESVTGFCVKQLCRVLCTNFRFWVAFPSPIELKMVSSSFEALTGLPNCCGVIDCTRFKIVREDRCNKLSPESIAAQIVVDSSSRILSIVAGFRGDRGDSRVLKSSTLFKDVEGGTLLNSPPVFEKAVAIPQYLVGDGGYSLLPWMMVPFVDPVPGSCEEDFNAAHHLMRVPALRTIASLRNWGVLSRPIEGEFKTAVAYIGACSILHNVLLMREDYSALSDGLHDQSSQYYRDACLKENSIERKGSVIRNALATRARELRNSNHPMNPSVPLQLQPN